MTNSKEELVRTSVVLPHVLAWSYGVLAGTSRRDKRSGWPYTSSLKLKACNLRKSRRSSSHIDVKRPASPRILG